MRRRPRLTAAPMTADDDRGDDTRPAPGAGPICGQPARADRAAGDQGEQASTSPATGPASRLGATAASEPRPAPGVGGRPGRVAARRLPAEPSRWVSSQPATMPAITGSASSTARPRPRPFGQAGEQRHVGSGPTHLGEPYRRAGAEREAGPEQVRGRPHGGVRAVGEADQGDPGLPGHPGRYAPIISAACAAADATDSPVTAGARGEHQQRRDHPGPDAVPHRAAASAGPA